MKQFFILFTLLAASFFAYGDEEEPKNQIPDSLELSDQFPEELPEETPAELSEEFPEELSQELSEEPAEVFPVEYPIIQITKANIKKLLRSKRPLIIDFYTTWCGPCKHMHKVIQEVNLEYGDLYQFGKINAEKEKYLASVFGIKAYPTVVFIKDGKAVGRFKGFINKEAFIQKMNKFFNEE